MSSSCSTTTTTTTNNNQLNNSSFESITLDSECCGSGGGGDSRFVCVDYSFQDIQDHYEVLFGLSKEISSILKEALSIYLSLDNSGDDANEKKELLMKFEKEGQEKCLLLAQQSRDYATMFPINSDRQRGIIEATENFFYSTLKMFSKPNGQDTNDDEKDPVLCIQEILDSTILLVKALIVGSPKNSRSPLSSPRTISSVSSSQYNSPCTSSGSGSGVGGGRNQLKSSMRGCSSGGGLSHSISIDSPLLIQAKRTMMMMGGRADTTSSNNLLRKINHINFATSQYLNNGGSNQFHFSPIQSKSSLIESAESTPTHPPTGYEFQDEVSTTMDLLSSLIKVKEEENLKKSTNHQRQNSGNFCKINHEHTNSNTTNSSSLLSSGSITIGANKIHKSKSDSNIMFNTLTFGEIQLSNSINQILQIYPNYTNPNQVDTTIWLEEPKEGENVFYIFEDPNSVPLNPPASRSIKSATLNQLILKLTNEANTELKFVKTFIATYRSFTNPETFLQKLIQRYYTPNIKNVSPYTFRQSIQLPIQLRVLNVLRMWVEQNQRDFDPEMYKTVTLFLGSTRKNGHGQFSDLILKRFTTKIKEKLEYPVTPIPKPKIFWMKYSSEYIFKLDANDIAEQLTLMDFDTYKSIEEIELINQAWSKPDQKSKTPNVFAMVNRFNSMSSFVSWSILRERDIKIRAKMMLKMIKICIYLSKLNNFNGLLAFLSGLTVSSVYRLTHTKSFIPKQYQKKLETLCKLLDTHKSHKFYRDTIHSTSPPLIPYLGIYLTDLTFIEDGNRDEMRGLINFKKRELIFTTLMEIQQYQQQSYNIKSLPDVIQFLYEIPVVENKKKFEDYLHEQSLLLEPRDCTRLEVLQKCGYKR
eukprot:gene2919-3637_t